MQKKKKVVAAIAAAVMLAGCGAQSASSAVASSISLTSTQSNETQISQESSAVQQTSENTWKSTASDVKFNMDFRKSPQTSSGEGYVENLDGIALAAGASDSMTGMIYEGVDANHFSVPTEVPDALVPCFVELLNKAKWHGVASGPNDDPNVVIDEVQDMGMVNGYHLARFRATYSFTDLVDRVPHEFSVVGYTVLLHQSNYPVYVLAADMTDEQSHVEELNNVALTCIKSLRETA